MRSGRRLSWVVLTVVLPGLVAAPLSAWEGPPFLWRVEKGAAEGYVFGTVHLGDPRLRILPPAVNAAFERSAVVYTEIPFDPPSLAEAQRGTRAPDGEDLRQRLPEDLFREAGDLLAAIDESLHMGTFTDMRVWAFALELVTLEARLRHPFIIPMDYQLYQRALQEGRVVRALETVEEQLAVFQKMTPEEEETMLRDTLAHLRDARGEGSDPMEDLIRVYLSGDTEALAALMDVWLGEASAGGGDFRDALLARRDAVMADRMIAHLQGEPERIHFFAVGAAHLISGNGILDHLEAAGWRVSRVELE